VVARLILVELLYQQKNSGDEYVSTNGYPTMNNDIQIQVEAEIVCHLLLVCSDKGSSYNNNGISPINQN
jgi:hypothetical protein